MGRSKRVTDHDYQSLLRLAGEAGEIADGVERRQLFLTRMGQMLGASCGVLCRTGWDSGAYRLMEYHVEDSLRIPSTTLKAYFTGKLPLDPMALHMDAKTSGYVMLRAEAMSNREWYCSAHYQDYRRHWMLNDGVYGKIVTRSGRVYGISFIRDVHDGLMCERERELLRIFATTIAPMLELDRWQKDGAVVSLTPRQRAIARCYMRGLSAKQIARELSLSDATVREYTKIMHRKLNVSSRGELLALLFTYQREQI